MGIEDRPRLVFLGTGTAFHTDGRGSQAILAEPRRGSPFLVDVAPTAMSAIARLGVRYDRIDRLFVTHLHGDHVAGWPFLLLNLALEARRERPFEVFGPEGTAACLEGLARLCYAEIASAERRGFEIRYRELPVARRQGIDAGEGLTIDGVPVEHHATSIGYRFEMDGTSFAVTGDTGWCAGLETLSERTELLVAECTWVSRRPGPHLSLEEIRERRDRLASPEILLTHLTDAVAAALAERPIRGVRAASDGMTVPLGA